MRFRLMFVVTLVLAIVIAPAKLVDKAVAFASSGQLRIAYSNGSVWSGTGLLSVSDVGGKGKWRPWSRISWSLDPFGLFLGRIRWRIIFDSGTPASVSAGVMSWDVTALSLHGPANNFLQRVPGPLGNLRWDGDISISIGEVRCSWHQVCSGNLVVHWLNAGSDFLPGQIFGSYELSAQGKQGTFGLSWKSSEKSYVQSEGDGEISAQEGLRLEGTISGDGDLLTRLPAIAGPWARPTTVPGTWKIHYP